MNVNTRGRQQCHDGFWFVRDSSDLTLLYEGLNRALRSLRCFHSVRCQRWEFLLLFSFEIPKPPTQMVYSYLVFLVSTLGYNTDLMSSALGNRKCHWKTLPKAYINCEYRWKTLSKAYIKDYNAITILILRILPTMPVPESTEGTGKSHSNLQYRVLSVSTFTISNPTPISEVKSPVSTSHNRSCIERWTKSDPAWSIGLKRGWHNIIVVRTIMRS